VTGSAQETGLFGKRLVLPGMAFVMEYSGLERSLGDDCSQDKVMGGIFFWPFLRKLFIFASFMHTLRRVFFLFDKLSAPIEGFPRSLTSLRSVRHGWIKSFIGIARSAGFIQFHPDQ